MKTSVLLLSFAAATAIGRAGPTDDVIIQAMRLGEAPNYSWITTATDESSSYSLEGRTQPAGFTWLRMPSVPALAEALGRSGEIHLEALYRGRATFVLRAANGWVSMEELSWNQPRVAYDSFALARGRPGGRMGTLGAPLPARMMSNPAVDPGELRLPGNIHLGLNPPHEELGIIVSSFTDLQVHSDYATGKVSDLGAALLLVRDGQLDATPLAANGTFQLWFKNGYVTRYQLRLEGMVAIGRKTIPVRRYSTTVVKDVGTTRLSVPDEAQLKLVN